MYNVENWACGWFDAGQSPKSKTHRTSKTVVHKDKSCTMWKTGSAWLARGIIKEPGKLEAKFK